MQRTAMLWIRDGVLINRMPVNAVAFAVAALVHADPKQSEKTNLTALVNFAFETSGISCADKMRKFNAENFSLVSDVTAAADYYNLLASKTASECRYFDGACELIRDLRELGVLNFITSAVEQAVLDTWTETPQGKLLVPDLTEVLGKRSNNFNKGKDHFAFVRAQYGVERMFYVADAVAEISTGAQFSSEFNISPIGFAHVITKEKVRQAHALVMDAYLGCACAKASSSRDGLALDEAGLFLPKQEALVKSLKHANAAHVVSGDAKQIMSVLADYLGICGVLQKRESSNG